MTVFVGCLVGHPAVARSCDASANVIELRDTGVLVIDHPIDESDTVKFAGIELAPLSGSATANASTPADDVHASILRLIDGARVCLTLTEGRQNRYGQLLAHVYRDDGLWLQGELLRAGLARVRVTPDARLRASDMLAIEQEARVAGRGIWRDPRFRVRSAASAEQFIGSFQLVEGRVRDAARHQDRWYLNFGADWRDDFTVSIAKDALPGFEEAGIQPYSLKGRTIRARGWIESVNGPFIDVLVPEQIEIVDDAPDERR
jgi:Staphylococcal nuclease homologue